MSRQPLKVSGMIASGHLAPKHGVAASQSFDPLPPPATGSASPGTGISTPPSPTEQAGVEMMLNVELLDSSPYQTRLNISSERVDELSASFKSGGQSTPITVRVVTPGRYEIIKGETRKRAAINIGWHQIRALVVVRDDQAAERDVMLDNQGLELNEYELAVTFERAKGKGYARTQAELADFFACSQSKVSKCLAMLELPEAAKAFLNASPGLFGAAAAKVITTLWKEHPDDHEIILKGIERIRDGAEQNGLKAWVTQQMKADTKRSKVPQRHVIPSAAGTPRYVTRVKDRDIIVRCSDHTIDPQQVQKWIDEALRKHEENIVNENNVN